MKISSYFSGDLFGVAPHPNVQKISRPENHVWRVDDHVYIVPYEGNGRKFLKTIIPSRRATKEFNQRKEL